VALRLSDFDYDLPADRIATRPAEPRDASRLLVLRRATRRTSERVFSDLPELLDPGDLLVVNDTEVLPARLVGRRVGTGGEVEVFVLREEGGRRWRALVSPARRMRPGVRIAFGDASPGRAECVVVAEHEAGERTVEFEGETPVPHLLARFGAMPLPPYMKRPADDLDRTRYQTVYASVPGAVAAPTAGLHFTQGLLARLSDRGVGFARVTLHVGPGTFRPVLVADPSRHRMDPERYDVPAATVDAVARAKRARRRVVAVGTTVVRTLESAVSPSGGLRAGPGETSLFVHEPYDFRVVDALVTNFHLPRSTLLMLVCAFAGRDLVLRAYARAVRGGFRFYSYGDAMLVL
jgi:S-adenosylmethionine:tRNA ribosyltransferase-isomerase